VQSPTSTLDLRDIARWKVRLALCVLGSCALGLFACTERSQASARVGGDAVHGKQVIRAAGCAACHTIPGIELRGVVAAPLDAFARRTFIAGVVPNTPVNLVRWVMDPLAIDPRTAMPAVGLTQAEAQDVAAYLYTLD
jgi:cytochrome c